MESSAIHSWHIDQTVCSPLAGGGRGQGAVGCTAATDSTGTAQQQVKPAFQQSEETLWGDVWEVCTFVYGWLFRHWNTRAGVKLGAVLPLLLARKQVSAD